ncbi:MAG: ATP-binding protein [Raineya sp.]|jgi:AAA15 family ATPase/GTPase|nr:ATP-binding protein [Raineya sp.]
MIDIIHIQNFKSLADVRLQLKQINVLIGANNSGKSNFLKALKFLTSTFYRDGYKKLDDYVRKGYSNVGMCITLDKESDYYVFQMECNSIPKYNYEVFLYGQNTKKFNKDHIYINNLSNYINYFSYRDFNININGFKPLNLKFLTEYSKGENKSKARIEKSLNISLFYNLEDKLYQEINGKIDVSQTTPFSDRFNDTSYELNTFFKQELKIYHPDPNKIKLQQPIQDTPFIEENAENITSFLIYTQHTFPKVFKKIEEDLQTCIPEFEGFVFKEDSGAGNRTYKKVGLYNHKGENFWSDELSEGVLYFIALLCIIHQPNPPKLLLLEEIEKGIHPRRIKEVVKFLQKLADEKDIQIILTTHSPIVLNELSYDTEAIFAFDKDSNNNTVIKSVSNIIKEHNANAKKLGLDAINFEENLGEYWLDGFLNGVPNENS